MEPQRSELQDILRQYAAGRLELLGSYGQSNFAPLLIKASTTQNRMWNVALLAVKDDPRLTWTLLPPQRRD